MRASGLRPASVSRQTYSLVAVSVALLAVARTTGSGWLVVVLVGIAAIVAVSAVLPAFGLLKLRVAVVAPRDATATRPAVITLDLDRATVAVKVRSIDPPGEWVRAEAPSSGQLLAVPPRRGVAGSVRMEVRSGGPLGLVWWRRTFEATLDRPMEIGPFPIASPIPEPEGGSTAGTDDRRASGSAIDVVRSTRDYVQGDPIKLVHWAATARYGELVVKELESPVSPELVIVVDLTGRDEDAVERAAGRAAGTANAALRLGVPVVLVTAESDRDRVANVATPVEVGRRLARAARRAPSEASIARGAIVVRVTSS